MPVTRRSSVEVGSNIELKKISPIHGDQDVDSFAASAVSEVMDTAVSTLPSEDNSKAKAKFSIPFRTSWLMWWNSEEWWSCWIGLIFFGCIASAVKHNIPQPEFLPWETNPFHTFGTTGNFGLFVIFAVMGILLWIAMAATRAPNYKRFPIGFVCVFMIALVSKMLASNGT